MGALKTMDSELDEFKNEVGDYDQSPDILKKMAEDFFKDKENCKYVTNYEKDGDTYKFSVNVNQFILTAYDDYNLKIASSLIRELREETDIVNLDLTLKLDGSYLGLFEMKAYEQDDPNDYFSAKITFTDMNKVSFENSRTNKLIKECKANGATPENNSYIKKNKLMNANANAKTAYNAAAECFMDAETAGCSLSDVFECSNVKWYIEESRVYDAQQQYGSIAGKVAEVLCENGDKPGYFKVVRQEINGRDSFVVYWSEKEDSEVIGRYPDAVSWDSFMNTNSHPDINSISFGDYKNY